MQSERRRRRSDVVHVATHLFLESLAVRARCEAIAVANDEGLLLGGTGDAYDLEWLAALSVLDDQPPPSGGYDAINKLQSYPFEIHGMRFHVACVSERPFPLDECAAAMRRIYAPLLS